MKRMDNLRSLSTDKLKNRLANIEPEIHRAEVHKSGWAVSNPPHSKMLHNLKKEKARILTILHERVEG